MANVSITQLPPVLGLNGTEQLEAVQSGSSAKITVAQIVSFATGTGGAQPLPVASGGTGNSSLTANSILLGNGTSAIQQLASPTSAGYVLASQASGVPYWTNTLPATAGVDSISFGTTGLTPSTLTQGAITVGGTLAVANGGTGVTTSTGSGSNVLSTSPTLTTPTIASGGAFLTPQSSAPTFSVGGQMWYDSSVDSMAYYTSSGYEVNPGQQVDQVGYNNTGSTIPAGTAVYLSGGSNGNAPYISPAIATSTTNANMVGITGQSIASGATGVVVILGQVFNYNTTGLSAGATLYLSPTTAGALTATQPTSPYYAVRAGFVVSGNTSNGIIFVSVRNIYSLGSNIISPVSLTAFSTSSNVLTLYGYSSSQIADLLDVYTYSGGVRSLQITGTGATTITSGVTGNVPLTINGVSSSQTANLLNVNTYSGGTNVFSISNSGTTTASALILNGSITSSANAGAISYGTLLYSDIDIFESFHASINNYVQTIVSNASNGSTASTDIIVGNNNTTATTYYGDFGINSSGWAGTVGTNSFNAPNMVYVTATTADLLIGTTTSNAIRFATNGNSDSLIISTSGGIASTNGFYENAATISANYTIGTNNNAVSAGPVSVSGATVTVNSGSTWVIV
jgi:hypothetical protein